MQLLRWLDAIIIAQAKEGGLPITPAKNGMHKRKRLPQNMLKAWNIVAKSHPCELDTSGTSPSIPHSYTPNGRGHLLIMKKSLKYISWIQLCTIPGVLGPGY